MIKESISLHDEILERLPEGNWNYYTEVDAIITRETEKAVLIVTFHGEFGQEEHWIPKSQIAKLDEGPWRRFMIATWLVMKNRIE